MGRRATAALLVLAVLVLPGHGLDAESRPRVPAADPHGIPLIGDDARWPAVHGIGVCSTDYGWCPLAYPERVAPGTPCFCVTEARQQIVGVAVARMYYGHVNPFFNPWR